MLAQPALDASKECLSCGRFGGRACTVCRDVYFCDRECQRAVWSEHKKICAAEAVEKAVRRAGWLVQQLFLCSRERASTDKFISATWNNDRSRLVVNCNRHTGDFYRSSLLLNDKERSMVLSAAMCRAAVAHFSGLLEDMLKGELTCAINVVKRTDTTRHTCED